LSLRLSRKKASGERGWSVAIVILMTVGLTGWIVVPGVGNSLESGFSSYANAVGTYVIIGNNGAPSARNEFISSNTVAQIGSLAGVQSVFPIDINYTEFQFPNYTLGPGIKGMVFGARTALLGGSFGYPSGLLNLTSGRAPEGNEAGFIVNSPDLQNYNEGRPYTVGQTANVSIAGISFTATAVGVNSINPLLGDAVQVIWNATFVRNELGDRLFNQTFQRGVNYLIVKAASVDDVSAVASQVTNAMAGYHDYLVTYDQETADNLKSVESSTAPLYDLIGAFSLVSSIAAVFLVSYIATGRRGWETAMLLTQGWTWRRVAEFYWEYFSILAVVSYILSVLLSLVISRYETFSFQVFGTTLIIQESIGLFAIFTTGVIVACVTTFVPLMTAWRLKKVGLDSALRDF
jgi:hypothetical protein